MSSDNDHDFDNDDLDAAETQDALTPGSAQSVDMNLDDFDDDFDDDFEPEVAGEYEMDDDEFARQLVDMVDFEIEGLSGSDDDGDDDDVDSAIDED